MSKAQFEMRSLGQDDLDFPNNIRQGAYVAPIGDDELMVVAYQPGFWFDVLSDCQSTQPTIDA